MAGRLSHPARRCESRRGFLDNEEGVDSAPLPVERARLALACSGAVRDDATLGLESAAVVVSAAADFRAGVGAEPAIPDRRPTDASSAP